MSTPTLKKIRIAPGSMGAAAQAIDLFGRDRVIVGEWLQPVHAENLTDDEVAIAKELLEPFDLTVTVVDY